MTAYESICPGGGRITCAFCQAVAQSSTLFLAAMEMPRRKALRVIDDVDLVMVCWLYIHWTFRSLLTLSQAGHISAHRKHRRVRHQVPLPKSLRHNLKLLPPEYIKKSSMSDTRRHRRNVPLNHVQRQQSRTLPPCCRKPSAPGATPASLPCSTEPRRSPYQQQTLPSRPQSCCASKSQSPSTAPSLSSHRAGAR